MNVISCAALALLVGVLPASADTFRAINWLNVSPITETEFEVVLKPGASPRGVWCAASDYSWRRLGRDKKTDLIVKTPAGPSVTQPEHNGVVFTIDPNQVEVTPTKSLTVTTKRVGASLSVGHAKMFCPLLPGPAYNWR